MTIKVTYTKVNKKPETIKNVKSVDARGLDFVVVENSGEKHRYSFKERDYVVV